MFVYLIVLYLAVTWTLNWRIVCRLSIKRTYRPYYTLDFQEETLRCWVTLLKFKWGRFTAVERSYLTAPTGNRIQRFWLNVPRALTTELIRLPVRAVRNIHNIAYITVAKQRIFNPPKRIVIGYRISYHWATVMLRYWIYGYFWDWMPLPGVSIAQWLEHWYTISQRLWVGFPVGAVTYSYAVN